jgi:hypothetical protein
MSRFRVLAVATACLAIGTTASLAATASQVAAGANHTCALTTAGGVVCWGWNYFGQLGSGTTTWSELTPVPVNGLESGVTAIAVGGWGHTCALTTAGGILCWGVNDAGQLGDGTTTNRSTPTPVTGLGSGVSAIAAGWKYTCALKTSGGVVCWGENSYGQLGDGTKTMRATPTPVSGLSTGAVGIAAGGVHTCAAVVGGAVVCWGWNYHGQLGDGTTTDRLTPAVVSGLGSGVSALAAGDAHTCALTGGGAIACWGANDSGQIGDGTATDRSSSTPVSGLAAGAKALSAGGNRSCALMTAGGVVCWGANASPLAPVTVPGLERGVTAITVGFYHACAVKSVGAVLCWNENSDGQLGDGTTTSRLTPGRVIGLGPAAPSDFTRDMKSDVLWRHAARGEVWLWPMNGAARMTETQVGTVGDTNFEVRGLGDQNGDGKADVLWRHKTAGLVYYWPMNGATRLAESYVGTVEPAYDIVGTGDYNGDGKSDILWRHLTNGELWIWLMNGATVVSSTYVTTIGPEYAVVGSGDLNGDGKSDIVWRGKTNGDVWVWLMNGTTPATIRYVTTVPDLGYQIVGVADHTGDGKADILWWHNTRGEVWLWPMNGVTPVSQQYVGLVPDAGYRIVGNGDYDGDARADILWHHVTRGEVWVWLMNGATPLAQTYVASVPETGYRIIK